MDLDKRINQKREEAVLKESLDIGFFDDELTIDRILLDIDDEASNLKIDGIANRRTKTISIGMRN